MPESLVDWRMLLLNSISKSKRISRVFSFPDQSQLRLSFYPRSRSFFFFNDTAPPEIYTLSLHDALPISLLGIERALLLLEQAVELLVLVEREIVAGRPPEAGAEVLDRAVDVAVHRAPAEERGLHRVALDRQGRLLRERAPLEVHDLHGHPDLLEVALDRLQHLPAQKVATRRVVYREGQRGLARLAQQAARLLGVVAVVIVGLGVAVAARRARRVERRGGAREHALHDRGPIDRVVEGLPHPPILEDLLGVQVEPDHPGGGGGVEDRVRVGGRRGRS